MLAAGMEPGRDRAEVKRRATLRRSRNARRLRSLLARRHARRREGAGGLLPALPDADIFTHVHLPEKTSALINRHPISTTFIARLPFAAKLYQRYLPSDAARAGGARPHRLRPRHLLRSRGRPRASSPTPTRCTSATATRRCATCGTSTASYRGNGVGSRASACRSPCPRCACGTSRRPRASTSSSRTPPLSRGASPSLYRRDSP